MYPVLIIFSGPIASGKSTAAKELEYHEGALYVTTREPLNEAARVPDPTRRQLQDAGVMLDHTTKGAWVLDHLLNTAARNPGTKLMVLDCIRTMTQLEPILKDWPAPVLHTHLTASPEILSTRYTGRGDEMPRNQALQHPAERGINALQHQAQLMVDTSATSPQQIRELVKAAAANMADQHHQATDTDHRKDQSHQAPKGD